MRQTHHYRSGVHAVILPTPATGAHAGKVALLKAWLLQHWVWVVLTAAVALNTVNHIPFIFPGLYEIDPFDESLYIFRGKAFAEALMAGRVSLPDPAWNPLGSILYGMAYLPNQESGSWLVRAEWMVRATLYAGLWLATLSVARALRPTVPAQWFLGVCAAVTAFPFVLGNNSDSLFAILSALVLAQLLRFQQNRRLAPLAFAALFLGLGALTRADGLLLTAITAFVVLVLTLRERGGNRVALAGGRLLVLLVPMLLLTGGYQALYGIVEPAPSTNLNERTYMAFEQGEGGSMPGDPVAMFERTTQVRDLYGTPEQNEYSVFNAIRRNPAAFLERAQRTLSNGIPQATWLIYGPFISMFVLALAVIGTVALLRRRQTEILLLLLVWPLHLGVYLLTFVRTGYLALPFAAVLALSAVGAQAVAARGRGTRKLALATLLAAAVVLIQSTFLSQRLFPTGVTAMAFQPAEVKAADFMRATLAPGTRVASFTPRPVWSAELEPVLTGVPVAFVGLIPVSGDLGLYHAGTPQEAVAWLRAQGAEAVYLDAYMAMWQPRTYALLLSGIGSVFDVAFLSDEPSPRNLAYLVALAEDSTLATQVRVLTLRP